MKAYVGTKIIKAEPMDDIEFNSKFKNKTSSDRPAIPGYHVRYPDGYDSWSPKPVFEGAYPELRNGSFELSRRCVDRRL